MNEPSVGKLQWCVCALLALWLNASVSSAATLNVSVGDNFFSPSTLTINTGDTVVWTWNGFATHNVTSSASPFVLASGNKAHGGTFSFTFNSVGTFPYLCTIHSGQIGTITVQAANTPPTVSITSPTNNASLLAGSNATIQGNATDNGSVTRVDLFASGSLIGSVTTAPFAPFSFLAANIPAGNYVLTAVATDNLGATNISAGVNIQVLTNATVVLKSATSFVVSNSFGGQNYFVDVLTNFSAGTFGSRWFPIATNTAASNDFFFTDSVLPNTIPRFYRVRQTY